MKNIDLAKFFAVCRGNKTEAGVMGPTLDGNEVSGAENVIKAMTGTPLAYVAYALATTWHETAHTMQPIKEYGGPRYFRRMYDISGSRPALAKKMGNVNVGDGVKYIGRGLVQITWYNNYLLAQEEIGVSLVDQPDLALRPDVASMILRQGMTEGWFTKKKLSDFLPSDKGATYQQFKNARAVINGRDDDDLIANYALQFQKALQAGGYRV